MNRTTIYKDYLDVYDVVRDVATDCIKCTTPISPLSFYAFTKYGGRGYPSLRIAKSTRDFCMLFTTLRNDINSLTSQDVRFPVLNEFLFKHRNGTNTKKTKSTSKA